MDSASDKCQTEKTKTINVDGFPWAMATLGFEDYIEPLKVYLARYREMESDTKGSAKATDGSIKRDGMQPGPNSQLTHQGSFLQGMTYETLCTLKPGNPPPPSTEPGKTKTSLHFPPASVLLAAAVSVGSLLPPFR
ncbi:Nuclear transcription factor Y subunit B-8 [Datura stramonium]|uniref:Nuclear transcription factor Y subunit B-8 n=1 Tax=Datura stramonium TaxID=4076 RepID=A0ABS8Y6P1_DATST|nr:Nuclear transcription factor Y subunit B-8 [Datura stramonium]